MDTSGLSLFQETSMWTQELSTTMVFIVMQGTILQIDILPNQRPKVNPSPAATVWLIGMQMFRN